MKPMNTLAAALLACGLALCQEPGVETRPAANDAVKAAVKNLDNDSFELRTKAMEDLRAAGESARPELEAALKSDSLEVRTRAETLLKDLDARKAASGGQKKAGLKPLAPDGETQRSREDGARGGNQGRTPQPRFEDFRDPHAFIEAMEKWMQERLDKDSRFPGWVLPGGEDPDRDVVIIGPDGVKSGGASISIVQSNGETLTYKRGEEGVTLTIQGRNEKGELETRSYTGKDDEELKAQHPEAWAKWEMVKPEGMGQGFSLRSRRSGLRAIAPRPPMAPAPPEPQADRPVAPVAPDLDPDRPRLGILTSPVPPVLDRQLKLKGEGVVIDTVYPNSLAAKMGIQELDVLLQLDGQAMHDRDEILRFMAKNGPPTTVRIVREGAVMDLAAPKDKGR